MKYTTYILYSESLKKYYVGSTVDLADRLRRHNNGEGKFTKKGMPWELIWSNVFASRSEAVSLEMKIKKRGIKRFLEDQNTGFGK
ncbi:GIY-YIG nuclease family protein [Niabella sp. CC-SYL272]|uniref:GIY-YIG nuclease family protein n=1 Tax=Niabella agricola TaxID=2891571 RepID=UPI003872BA88|nr:GIY-YIG nuclease family protein [Niabella agricola]